MDSNTKLSSYLQNELEFCSLWTNLYILSKSTNTNTSIKIFFNKNFSDDYFFNRIFFDNENDILESLKFLKKFLTLNRISAYIHLQTDSEYLRKQFKQNNFNWIDSIYTLESAPIKQNTFNSITLKKDVSVIKINDPMLINQWTVIFCRSFNIRDYSPFIEVLNKNKERFIFLLAYINNNSKIKINDNSKCPLENNIDNMYIPVGGCILFEQGGCLGLYCLGTLPEFRNKGIAKMIIRTSLKLAYTMNYQNLFLNTLKNDNYLEIYKKFSFSIIDERKIFQIN